MRICKIYIERFLGIRKLSITVNDGLQLIAGPNNSCKSTLLKALNFFFAGDSMPFQEDYAPQNAYYSAEGNRALTRIKLHFSDLTDEEFKIFKKAFSPRARSFWVELKITRAGDVSYVGSNSTPGDKTYNDLIESYDVLYVPAVRAGDGETRKLFIAAKAVLAKKKRGSSNRLQREYSSSVEGVTGIIEQLLEESRQAVVDSLPPETAISFKFPSTDRLLDLILSETTIGTRDNTTLTVDNEGTGFQSLLSLGLLRYVEGVNRSRNQLFLVEEPEAFLHPQYQRSVADYILSLAEKSQIMITTHSAVIVDSVEIKHIVRLFRQPNGLEYDWGWTDDQISDAAYLSRYCDAKNSELIFADKVILCEGISDHNVISVLLEGSMSSSHHNSNISVICGDGSALKHVARLLNWFEIDHFIVLDKDSYAGVDRDVLKSLCKDKLIDLTQAEYAKLDKLKAEVCNNLAEAASVREAANEILAGRSIFTLGSDIEGSVIHSFSRARILEHLGPDGLGHFSGQTFNGISVLAGREFMERVDELLGSKGWSTGRSNRSNKPKPHVLANFVRRSGVANFRINSDLAALSDALTVFVNA